MGCCGYQKYFNGKRVLITGATTGIGRDLAIYLASLGAHLLLTGRREALLKEVKGLCAVYNVESDYFIADVADRSAMEAMGRWALSKGNIDIVIANAGVGCLNPADNFSIEVHEKVVAINVLGLAYTFAPFIEQMKERRSGHLVGVSSLAAFRGLPGASSYSASKAAQARFLESFRVDLQDYNIQVTSIHPGFVSTPMTNHSEFPMPFMVPVEKSSRLIARAIACKKAVYLYPLPMRLLTMINRVLPCWLFDLVFNHVSKKNRNKSARTL